jgi:Retrotransposon gag protein/Zinc knuckle
MPPKAPTTTPGATTTSGSSEDTSMRDVNSQTVTVGQLQEIVDQMQGNNMALEARVNSIGAAKVKLPSIERYAGEKSKLKGFLAQMRFKVLQEGGKLATPMDQVVYAGLFLSGRALEWFEPYLTEIQEHGDQTINPEAKYMFSSWSGFASRLTQMFGDPEATTTAERKLQGLIQRTSAIEYTTQFQTLSAQVEWNDKALMAQYKQGLKAKVQDAIILMEDAETMRELIDQAIKIDNRIFQREQAKRGQDRVPQSYKTQNTHRQSQSQKPWNGGPEPMDLSGTKESKKKWTKKPWKPRGQGSSDHRTQEYRPNQGSQQQKKFERTPQQDKWFKEGACMNCGKPGHYARDCRSGQRNHAVKGTRSSEYDSSNTSVLRGTKECSINHFTFCYNNNCRIHSDAKYGASYWPQEPSSEKLRATLEQEEQDRLYELDQDEDGTASQQSAEKVLTHQFHQAVASKDQDDRTISSDGEADDFQDAITEAEVDESSSEFTTVGMQTPLDTMSIASRDDRSSIQEGSSKRTDASASSSLDKGKRPQTQDSQDRMRETQGPTTDENRWERAAAQFSNIRMSSGHKFPDDQDFDERMRHSTSIPRKPDVSLEDRTVDTLIKKHDDFKDPLRGREPKETMAEFRARMIAWQNQDTGLRSAERLRIKTPIRKITNRPRVGTPRAKWLNELEEEENLGVPTRFAERHTKGCNDAAMKRYFLTDKSYTLTELYRKWYKQRHNDEWEDFYMWLDEKVIADKAMSEGQMGYIKGALIMTSKNLEEQAVDWRETIRVSVPASETATLRSPKQRFELRDEDEPRVDPKHPAHHTLSWIACVDDTCNMHSLPKDRVRRYPRRMYWAPEDHKYRNAKYMHGWHPIEVQEQQDLTLQPGRFLTEECLEGREWWECPENTCPWHIEDKKRTKYWPKVDQVPTRSSSQQSGKGEAHRTRGSQW